MTTLQTQYQNYLKENPESTFTFEEWSEWKFSNMELPPPHNGLRSLDEYEEELGHWDVTLMDGLEAIEQIRKFNKDVKIIAQTAFAQEQDILKAFNAGCNNYISKPINAKNLGSIINNLF